MTLSQNLVVQNQDSVKACALTMTVVNNGLGETPDLASVLWVAIHDASQTYLVRKVAVRLLI